jgi:predicted nucleic acid-binding protein
MATSVVIDANLLVLFIAGRTDPDLIQRHRNLTAYDADAFDLLVETLAKYPKIALTPGTLTEASNLLRQIREPDRHRVTMVLGDFIRSEDEIYIPSRDASREVMFGRLGLTDAALLILARNNAALLSADNDLYLAASKEGINAINFAHLYEARFG